MPDIIEQQLQTQIQEYLKKEKWYVYKNNLQGVLHGRILCKNPSVGCADLTAIKNSTVIQIEVKIKGNKQSPDQIKFEKLWTEHGGIYWLIYSLEELIIKINSLTKK